MLSSRKSRREESLDAPASEAIASQEDRILRRDRAGCEAEPGGGPAAGQPRPASVRGAHVPDAGLDRRRAVVEAFLAASRGGDLGALLALLDPDVVVRADRSAGVVGGKWTVKAEAPGEVGCAAAVAEIFSGRAWGARLALLDGAPSAVWAPGGQLRVAFCFTITGDRITERRACLVTNSSETW